MTRKEFLKMCGILGISIPLYSTIMSCTKENSDNTFNGKVIIIGAGAGGLTAGYLLKQQGIEFKILEASSVYGGRMKIDTNFADFPIPLGAEWLETNTNIFKEIVNNSSVSVEIETSLDHPDRKFINYSWFNFFEEYIIPSISENITYNSIVESIDYSDEKTIINTQNGQYTSDKVIISVPLKILQDGDINFIPNLAQIKQDAINKPIIWEGFKAFFEFSNTFYDNSYEFPVSPQTDGQKIFYNASLGQNTNKNILGLFVVGKPTLDYLALSDNELKDFVLDELDSIYTNQATPNYIKHISQNWNNEPFIKAGYLTDYADFGIVKKLSESVSDKLYFAGGAYTNGDDWVSVHTAAQSAKEAIKELMR